MSEVEATAVNGQLVMTLDWPDGQSGQVPGLFHTLRTQLREWRFVRLWRDRLAVIDINGDYIYIEGLGYASPDIHHVLKAIGTAYNTQTIHDEPARGDYKQFKTGRRHPWAEDRVM